MNSFNARALVASPLIILLLSGTRLLMVSNYDSDTAITLIKTGGIGDTVLGTLIPLLPIILPLLTVILFVIRRPILASVSGVCTLLIAVASPGFEGFRAAWDEAVYNTYWYVVGIMQVVNDFTWDWVSWLAREIYSLVVRILPGFLEESLQISTLRSQPHADSLTELWQAQWLISILVIVVLITVFLNIEIDPESGTAHQRSWWYVATLGEFILLSVRTCTKACAVAIGSIVLYFAAAAIYPVLPSDGGLWQASLHRFWQPPEHIWLKSGKREVAYVLGEKDGWQVLLADDRRIIQYVKPDELTARRVCSLQSSPTELPLLASTGVVVADPPPCYAMPKKPAQ